MTSKTRAGARPEIPAPFSRLPGLPKSPDDDPAHPAARRPPATTAATAPATQAAAATATHAAAATAAHATSGATAATATATHAAASTAAPSSSPIQPGSAPGPSSSGSRLAELRQIRQIRQITPGLSITVVAVAVAWAVNTAAPAISPLTCSVILGALAANLRLLPRRARAGLGFAGKRLMRLGIVLLGLKLALSDVGALGWKTLVVTVLVVLLTFLGTQWLGKRLGLPGDQPLLVATGFSICGASAVAAMNSVTDSDDDDVLTSVALVTLCGTLAIIVLPLLHHPLGLGDIQFGRWVGASVHDVGQVVATAQTAGPAALDQAVIVKLMRIAMLAPLVTSVALARRRRAALVAARDDAAAGAVAARGTGSAAGARRPPLVPLFVLGFLAMVAVRSTGIVDAHQVDLSQDLSNLLLSAGLFALGTGVDVPRLARTGGRALALGLISWLLIASAAYLGVRLTT
jgi:uncharacterized integral membrane protein (TIGR00698 family)